MNSTISINYLLKNKSASCTVLLFYTLEHFDDLLTITCYIESTDPKVLPWLHLKGFSIQSLLSDGFWSPLFNDQNFVRTVEAALFIDYAYKAIMAKENLPLHFEAFEVQ